MVVGVGDVHLPVGNAYAAGLAEQRLIPGAVSEAGLTGAQHGEGAAGSRQHPLYLVVIRIGHVKHTVKAVQPDGVL